MREALFIKKNKDKWQQIENYINLSQNKNPDELANYYINLSDDFAYAQTNYPKSNTTIFINNLLVALHQKIYKNKKESSNRIVKFWKYEVPIEVYKNRFTLLYSLLFFLLFVLIGVISEANESDFSTLILGDNYVRMTKENIAKGDPMAVYKNADETLMFLAITINNIKVSFLAFLLGIVFTSFGTIFVLLQNGIMLGSFQYFFYEFGVLKQSLLTIWIHGTLEISAIVIAAGAGLVVGNSILFPKTYSRVVSFKNGFASGFKIVCGCIPIFIIAGFLEGFVTRHTEMPIYLSLFIIGSSLLFVIWYFVIYPKNIYLKQNQLKL